MNLLHTAEQLYEGSTIIRDWLGDGANTVDKETAQVRADICLKCPMNANGNPLSDAVAEVIKRTIELKNKLNLRVEGEKRLKTCQVCDCVMRLKIWMPTGRIQQITSAEEFARFPSHCFVKKEAA